MLLATGFATTAVTLDIVANDPRLLRAAVLAGLLSAFLPAMLLAAERKTAVVADSDELRRLRLELAELRGEIAAHAYVLAARPSAPERAMTLQLPLVRAALRVPVASANGHGTTLDLTDERLSKTT